MFVIFNHFKNVKLRLHFYSLKSGLPDSLLIENNVVFDVPNGRQKTISLNLNKYNFRIENQEEIAVVIQWLKSELNESEIRQSITIAAVPSSTNSIVFRDKSQSKWSKISGNISLGIVADSFKD